MLFIFPHLQMTLSLSLGAQKDRVLINENGRILLNDYQQKQCPNFQFDTSYNLEMNIILRKESKL